MSDDLPVNRSLTIPADELQLSFTTSGGPGGQHANRSSTRVVVAWNVATSQALGPRQRARIRQRLKNRIDSAGTLRVASDAHRSQLRNREEARERLAALVAEALRPERKRIRTEPTLAARERRLREKRRRSETKRLRRPSLDE